MVRLIDKAILPDKARRRKVGVISTNNQVSNQVKEVKRKSGIL